MAQDLLAIDSQHPRLNSAKYCQFYERARSHSTCQWPRRRIWLRKEAQVPGTTW